jgi:DNA-binding YbaB/EbfC family protein
VSDPLNGTDHTDEDLENPEQAEEYDDEDEEYEDYDEEPEAADGGFDLGSLLGGMNLGSILGAAQDMQAKVVESQQRLAAATVQGQSGGGAVQIDVNGGFQFQRVKIDPSVIDANDPEMLEDLILAALHDCSAQVEAAQSRENPVGGLDLGGLGGLGGLFGG